MKSSVMAANPSTATYDVAFVDATFLCTAAPTNVTLQPCEAQKRGCERETSHSASMPAACGPGKPSDEPPPKRRKPAAKTVTKTQEKRLRPLAPKLQPNSAVPPNSGVPEDSGTLPNFGAAPNSGTVQNPGVRNTQQGMQPLSSSEPVTLWLLCKPVRPPPNTPTVSLLERSSMTCHDPSITIITRDENGVVYTMVTRVDENTGSDTSSNNTMSSHVKESTSETEIIGIPTVDVGVEQCVLTKHERQAPASYDSAMLLPARNLTIVPIPKTGTMHMSAVESGGFESYNAGRTAVKEMKDSSSEPAIVGIPTLNLHLEHCKSEEGQVPVFCALRRTTLDTAESVARKLTTISSPSEKTGTVHSMLTKAEKASELCTSSMTSITSLDSAKDSSSEPTIIGIPVDIDTERSTSDIGERQTYRLCTPSKIKLEPPECTECEALVDSPESNIMHSPLTALEKNSHASHTSSNDTLSHVAGSGSKLASFGGVASASDVERNASTAVMGQPSSHAASSISLYPERGISSGPIVNSIHSDKDGLSGKLTLVKNEMFEPCASNSDSDTLSCASDSDTDSAFSDIPPEFPDVQHSMSTALESQASTVCHSDSAASSPMECNYSKFPVCNGKTSTALRTVAVPENEASTPHASSNTSSKVASRVNNLHRGSLPRSMPHSSVPSSSSTAVYARKGIWPRFLNRSKKRISLSVDEKTEEIVRALEHKVKFCQKSSDIVRALEHKITVPQDKIMFYRKKVNSLKFQFHNARQAMKQPWMLQDFKTFAMSVPHSTVADEEMGAS